MNTALWTIPLYLSPLLVFIGFIAAGYELYIEEKEKTAEAQKQLNDLQKRLYDTKQEIRTFLESVNPAILQKIDAGEKEFCVGFGALKQVELADLSKRPDFGRFLLFRKGSNLGYLHTANGKFGPLILELGQMGILEEYYLYPKDVLIK